MRRIRCLASGRRALVAIVVFGLTTAGVVPVASAAVDPPEGDLPEWMRESLEAGSDEIELAPWGESPTAPLLTPGDDPVVDDPDADVPDVPEASFPEATSWDVTLGASAGRAQGPTAEHPVAVRASAGSRAGRGASGKVTVNVLDREAAGRAGVSGFVFEVKAAAGRKLGDVAASLGTGTKLPAELEIDYSSFASAHGSDYASRLQVVALPPCALESPQPAGCQSAGVPLEAKRDSAKQRLVVKVEDLAGLAGDALVVPGAPAIDPAMVAAVDEVAAEQGSSNPERLNEGGPELDGLGLDEFETTPEVRNSSAPAPQTAANAERIGPPNAGVAVLAITSGVSGDSGTYGATPLSMADSWSVADGTGEFSYSYPLDIPQPAGGTAPTVGLGYSSGSVDGMTHGTNTQGSQVGLGFGDFANAFIERQYKPCPIDYPTFQGDLCWGGYNGTISLGGVAGALIPMDTDYREWRLESDPGWKIERIGSPGPTGESWKVTASDGTQYFFGLHSDPETGRGTEAQLWIPVYGMESTYPCYSETVHKCNMVWRWNLDRVVDPDGNLTTYFYSRETNFYKSLNGYIPRLQYMRAGSLDRIEYGRRIGSTADAAGIVTFGRQYRCWKLDQTCEKPTDGDTNGPNATTDDFFDVPTDLVCITSTTCTATSPAFFSGVRYTSVRADILFEGAYKSITQYNFVHGVGQLGGYKLYLNDVQQLGLYKTTTLPEILALPATHIDYQNGLLDNRVDCDATDTACKMRHYRIKEITNPYSGKTTVNYGQQHACPANHESTLLVNAHYRWDTNTGDCFPQSTIDNGSLGPGTYHKWLVTKITETSGHGSPAMETTYAYEGNPAWAFDYGAFARDDEEWGWSQWRGYGSVVVAKGSAAQGLTKTRARLFRGMHGDLEMKTISGELCPCGQRDVQVSTIDGPVNDDKILTGRTIDEESLGKFTPSGPETTLRSTRYSYGQRVTATSQLAGYDPARFAAQTSTTERVYSAQGVFRERGGKTTYNANLQPATSSELGWLDTPNDERCSVTTYIDNPSKWMFVYPSSNRGLAGACPVDDPQTPTDESQVFTGMVEVSASETYYDEVPNTGTHTNTPPTRGNPTTQRQKIDDTTWSETRTAFDDLGRPISVTDPLGATTTTAYTTTPSPTNAIPTKTVVTNALGHTTTMEEMPGNTPQTKETDANGNYTLYGYDPLRRLDFVRLPTEQPYVAGKARSWQFTYYVDNAKTAPPKVRSQQLSSTVDTGTGVNFEESWTLYDGFLRERQTQAPSPESGKAIVSGTTYDDRGLLSVETAAEAVTGTPGSGLLAPTTWANSAKHFYDALSRPTSEEQWRGGASSPQSTATFEYTVDTTTVTGPTGLKGREKLDGLGRTVVSSEYDSTAPGDHWVNTTSTYNLADKLLSVTDSSGNTTSYTYNKAGWRTTQTDPDRGNALFRYDAAGRQTSARSAEGSPIQSEIHTEYDVLGRPTVRHSGSASGPPLATWEYDTPTGFKGHLWKANRIASDGKVWTSQVMGYDGRGRVTGTRTIVPTGIPGLSGTYDTTMTYDRADRVRTVSYPAIGNVAAETVTTNYDSLGLAKSLTSPLASYVGTVNYDNRARPATASLGPAVLFGWMLKGWTYDADQNLATVEAQVANGGVYQMAAKHTLTYRNDGILSEQKTNLNGAEWRECYQYDDRARLKTAFTVATSGSTTCSNGTPGTGSNPFNHSYTYSPDGNLELRSENGVPTDYIYGAVAGQPPHAPTTIGSDEYEWDDNGNLVERTVDGATETLVWDIEQRLASVSGPGGATSFVYDPDGQRILRTTPSGRTLYLADHEVTASTDGSIVSAVRSYTFEGEVVATRKPTGVDFLLSDTSGSVELSAPSGGVPTGTRTYNPYGEVRNKVGGAFATDRGFVGQVEDSSTKLSYLNARYYDATVGVFLSTDPLYDTSKPKSLNPYSYASNSPATFSDPSGLMSQYTRGIESENRTLRAINAKLVEHIGVLGAQIAELQDVINNTLLPHIAALEGFIRQQQTIIDGLRARVTYLEGRVAYWRGEARKWRAEARKWKDKAYEYRRVAFDFVDAIYNPEQRQIVKDWIDKGTWPGFAAGPRVFWLPGRWSGGDFIPGHPLFTNVIDQSRYDLASGQGEIDDLRDKMSSLEDLLWLAEASNADAAEPGSDGVQEICDFVGEMNYVRSIGEVLEVIALPKNVTKVMKAGGVICKTFGY